MAEFDKARVLIHMNAGPCIFTRECPVAKNEIISGNQQALKMPITIARVNATRRSTWKLTGAERLAVKYFFASLFLIRKITIDK